jgi:multiple sugar transport system permease protein
MNRKKTIRGYLLLIPALILMGVFMFYPLVTTIFNSFFNKRTIMVEPLKFVYFTQYKNSLTDSVFLSTIKWTMGFTFISVAIELVLALVFALLMKKEFKGQTFVRIIILLPWAIPAVVAGLVWTNLFDYNGLINTVLLGLKLIKEPIFFFGNQTTAKMAIIIADVWKSVPYMSLLILAGLMGIPKDCYEASSIDGAGKIKQFFYITLPLLIPTISVSLMFRLIGATRSYGLVVAMTGGGPGNTTETMAMYAVDNFFKFGKVSYGSALSIIQLLLSLAISAFFVSGLKKKVEV